jgi:hypothetical protein
MKRSYVPVTLDAYLNESKTITLKRGYGERQPVVVGATAPLRNQVLSFVAESQRVTKTDLKKFIAGLNEGSKNPIASANMWLQRNSKFFVTESKNGITYFKLSPIGQRLAKRFASPSQISESETKNIRRKLNEMAPLKSLRNIRSSKDLEDFDEEELEDEVGNYDFVDRTKGYPRPGLYDEEVEECNEEKEEIEECDKEDKKMDESTKERIKKIIENIKAKRGQKLNEAEEEEAEDELTFDDLDLGSEDEKEEEGEELEDEGEEKEEEGEELEDEGEEKVEITEFVITVDNVEEAIEELSEEGVDAEQVVDEEGEPVENQIKVSADSWEALRGWLEEKGVDIEEMFGGEIEVEDEEGLEGEEIEGDEDLESAGEEGAEELEGEDFSLEGGDELEGLEGEEGEELGGEEEDVEESVEGMEREENQKTPNLVAGKQKQTPMKQTEFSGGKQVTITVK